MHRMKRKCQIYRKMLRIRRVKIKKIKRQRNNDIKVESSGEMKR